MVVCGVQVSFVVISRGVEARGPYPVDTRYSRASCPFGEFHRDPQRRNVVGPVAGCLCLVGHGCVHARLGW